MVGSVAPKAPEVIEHFVRQLIVTGRSVQLYPPSSEIPRQNAAEAVAALNTVLDRYPECVLTVTKNGLFFEDAQVLPKQASFVAFARELYHRQLASVQFHAGASVNDFITFLTVLKSSPDEVRAAGGYEAQMWEGGISAITVLETQVTLVDQAAEDELELIELDRADEQTLQPETSRSREHIEITRIMSDNDAVRRYLTERLDSEGSPLGIEAIYHRFSGFAEAIIEHDGLSNPEFIETFAQALWGLEPESRVELLETQLLPNARTSDVLGSVIRRVDSAEIVQMLAEGEKDLDAHRAGFTRALRNLVQVTHADRSTFATAAEGALGQAGVGETLARDIVTEAVPTRLTVHGAPPSARALDGTASLALKLIDHVPLSSTADAKHDEELAALRVEADEGVRDSDIIAVLVSLAGMETDGRKFANVMSVLEDSLDILAARGELDAAADAALTLLNAASNPSLTSEQRQRLGNAVTRFARSEDVRHITHALREYRPGQSQYEAAEKLLNTLGVLAIGPLLEQLAEEQDRGQRKALVDLISKNAPKYIDELSAHVNDSRWYFVRNVISILGSTRSPAVLGALERTLRHPEARVRRETIRAVAMVQDRMANEMLIAALADENATNVRLAARYLGSRGKHDAVSALEQVAKGEGLGNRENGPRIEAIQALGKIGAREALPALQSLARRRVFGGGARSKEIREAASAAVSTLKAKGGRR